jgi:hypothetical protein
VPRAVAGPIDTSTSSPLGWACALAHRGALRAGYFRVATLVGVEPGVGYDAGLLREIAAAAVPASIDATRQRIFNLRVP